jgi:PAS domain S-box-containing protein
MLLLLISDVDGTALLIEFRKTHPDMACMIITDHASVQNAINTLEDGAEGYFVKPLIIEEIVHRVEKTLDKQRMVREKRRAEEALRRSEKMFRDFAENAFEWIWEVDANGKYTYASPVAERILGYKPEELLKKHFYDPFHPEDREERKKAAFEVFAKKQPYCEFLNRNVHKNGRTVLLSTSGVPVLDDEGNLLGYRGTDIDITERKRAEESLRKSEERYRDLAELLPEVIFETDLEGNISYANQIAFDSFGYTQSDLDKGLNAFQMLIPEDRDRSKENIQGVLSGETSGSREYTAQRKDKTTFPILINSGPIIHENKPVGLRGVITDITERKRAEEKIKAKSLFLESLIQQSPLPTFVMDSKGFVVIVNEAFLKVYAVPNKEMVLGRNALTEPANVSQGVVKYFEEALSGKIVETPEVEFVSPYKNKKVITRSRMFPLVDPTGTLTNVVVVQEDITERKRAEEALQHLVEFERLITALSANFINLALDNIDDGINHALQTTGEFTGVDRSYVFLFSEDGTKMDNTHEWCSKGIEPQIDNLKGLSVEDFPWWMDKLNRFENIHIPRVADLPPGASTVKEILQPQGIQSLIVVPMIYGGSLVGYIGFDSVRTEKRWSEESIALLIIVGEIFVNALKRKQVEEALAKALAEQKNIMGTISDGIYMLDMSGNLVNWNKVAETVSGLSAKRLKKDWKKVLVK